MGTPLAIVALCGYAAMAGYRLYEPPVPDENAMAVDGVLAESPRLVRGRSYTSIYLTLADGKSRLVAEVPYYNFIEPRSVTRALLDLRAGQALTVRSTRHREPGSEFIASEVRASGEVLFSRQQAIQSRNASDLRLAQIIGAALGIGLLFLLLHRVLWALYRD